MRNLAAALMLSLTAACATTASGLAETDVERTFESAKAPQQLANCVADRLNGDTEMRNDGDHYWVIRKNGWGAAVTRWDFRPSPTGTAVELRTSIPINAGVGDVRDCL